MIAGIDIKVARMYAGLKQTEVADLMGVSQVLVSRWERDEIKAPPDVLAKIKEAAKRKEKER